jgi:hypothetical protein
MVIKKEKFLRAQNLKAQATIEFAFTFIVLVFIFYSCVRVLQWMGVALVSSTSSHYQGLYNYPLATTSDPKAHAVEQLENINEKTLPDLKIVYRGLSP